MTETLLPNLEEWGPAVHPAGRRFEPRQERELDPSLRRLAARLPGAGRGVLVSPEFPGPEGIADLVAVTQASDGLESRLMLGAQAVTGEADAAVVAAIAVNRTTSVVSIVRATGMSSRQVERRLRKLVADGLVRPVGSGYRRHPAMVPIGRLYAFEAKVSDWRAGLRQALRYSGWADAAGVVLLRTPRDTRSARDAATRLKIGLAVGDRWLVRPSMHRAPRGPRLLASERLVETARHQSPSAWA